MTSPTTRHSTQLNHSINNCYLCCDSTQRESMDAGVNISMSTSIQHNYIQNYTSFVLCTPILVRSAVKSYETSWCTQNLSKRALNWFKLDTTATLVHHVDRMPVRRRLHKSVHASDILLILIILIYRITYHWFMLSMTSLLDIYDTSVSTMASCQRKH